GIDTRALTKHIRDAGAMRAYLSTEELDPSALVDRARSIPPMAGRDLVKEVTTVEPYAWDRDRPHYYPADARSQDRSMWRHRGEKFSVVALDFGIKYNIIRWLETAGCEVIVVPASTHADTIEAMEPDGIFLSNGPGDPEPVTVAVDTIKNLLDYRPIFGICLGIQLLGLALGGKTYKLKFGHRGANQPVKNLSTGKIEITSQNHGFAVDIHSLPEKDIDITHINLNDSTLEGFRHTRLPIFAVQYHPEASPGPHDSRYLFDEFSQMMKKGNP
ncbi:MAG: glutamine-hydrolyzing carbamoyl-phosphate synthase small subunit, partial [Desulfobacterales bacterium]